MSKIQPEILITVEIALLCADVVVLWLTHWTSDRAVLVEEVLNLTESLRCVLR